MAREPDDLVLKLLREMRGEMGRIRKTFDQHSEVFKRVRRETSDWRRMAATPGGFTMHADVEAGVLHGRRADHEKWLKTLEATV